MRCDGVYHVLCTGGGDLGSVLAGYRPSRGFAAVDADIGHVGVVERRSEYFNKLSSLVSVRQHRSVRRGKIRLVKESKVRDFDAILAVQLRPFNKIVSISLFPVTSRSAVRSRDLVLVSHLFRYIHVQE